MNSERLKIDYIYILIIYIDHGEFEGVVKRCNYQDLIHLTISIKIELYKMSTINGKDLTNPRFVRQNVE